MDGYETICIIGEIFNGYSELSVGDLTVYVKHPSIKDQRLIQKIYEEHKAYAIKRGIETEKVRTARLIEDGLWNDSDELRMSQLEEECFSLETSIKNILLPSQKKKTQDNISEVKAKLRELVTKKSELIGSTAEYFASKRANEEFIRTLIYKDQNFRDLMYSADEFDAEEDSVLRAVLDINSENNKKFEDENLQRVVLSGEFSLYISYTDDPHNFFGRAVSDLSIYQLKLCAYGSLFDRIFKNVPDIPSSIRKDPAALLQFAENKNSTSNSHLKKNDNGGATAVFGATKEDLEILDPEAKKINLSKMLKDKGGSMDMQQMMEMMG